MSGPTANRNMKVALFACAMYLAVPHVWADDAAGIAKQPKIEQHSTDQANAKFKALDRNHDQHVSREEARKDPTLDKRFASIDINGDGLLNQAEFQAKPSGKEVE